MIQTKLLKIFERIGVFCIPFHLLTATVRNVVIPRAVRVAVDRLDSLSVREPMSYHTGEGHTASGLIQFCHGVQYQRRWNTVATWTYTVSNG